MLALIYAVAIGLSMARDGDRRPADRREESRGRVARGACRSIALGIAVAVPIGIAGALLAPRLLALMGASAVGRRERRRASRASCSACNVVILLLFLINAIFRGAGDAAIAMRVLWLANIINLVLDPCLIFGLGPFPALGVTGAAVATTCGRGIGVLVQLVDALPRAAGGSRSAREHLRLDPARDAARCCASPATRSSR